MSTTLMTFMTGSKALSVKVMAGMPPRPRVARLASKKGRETLLATKMAVMAEVQRGSTELGRAKTSKTVMAIAKARQTAAQKAEAPTMPQRAKNAPRSSSEGGTPFLVSKNSTNQSGNSTCAYTRPRRPPMIMVGATTPAGMAEDRARIVMHHFIKKHKAMVPATPAQGITHFSGSLIKRFLSKMVEINKGCGLPPKRGKDEASTVFSVTTAATRARSRHLPPSIPTRQRFSREQHPGRAAGAPMRGSWFPPGALAGAGSPSRRRHLFSTPAM
mmetsp:Transcript_51489/g.96441  ORF Transcript_51489/g.96441 Transcript_51489/m.96441 type:complete len:273 (+) Transcript_51489:477-1295(+)